MLFKQIPKDKIRMSKKILSFQQNHEGVMLRFSDNTTIHGDILVGADGAHSAVRQHLYKTLDKQGLLPKADTKAMSRGYISLVGTTDALDPEKYPSLLQELCETTFIIGSKDTPYTIGIAEIADDQFKSSDWVPQQNQGMMDSIRHFKTTYGTLGDLFDVTPIDRVSKVYFEDMLFETWTHGRTILIGDAAHKLLPSTGAGAVNAMQDAVLLANHIYDIKPTSFENIKTALKNYKEERFDAIKDQYPQSYISAKLMYGHSANILAAFEQLDLYEELMTFAKRGCEGVFYTDQMKVIASSVALPAEEIGYDRVLFSRPELYDMLFNKTPSHKVHLSKKIVSFDQDQGGVTVTFADDTTAHGDILVGADGAHSAVRKHLYKLLEEEGLLPECDTKAMSVGYVSLVGTTDALDPVKYPAVLQEECDTVFIIGDKGIPYTWATFTIPGNKICWNIVIQLGLSSLADEEVGSADWVAQDNRKMLDSIRHFKTTYGTLGELFDATPIERVSKVAFEDKLFETWNHGRVVVIGDAAHKLLPSTGAGAVNAMQDAVLLSNHIYDILPTSHENIEAALNEYKEERFDAIKEQYPQSYMSAKLMYGHTFTERILRHVVFNWMPKSIQRKQVSKDTAYRPQANFLPLAPKRGTLDIIPQRPSKRIQQKEEEAENKMASAL
ncbi:hypothetical protein BGW39_000560 [Mortierella sp. 14UC]|nr:hypothetical protein BGW39_000560 [Mortierella sp. 14UC]